MTLSALSNVKTKAVVYDLAELFAAVSARKDALKAPFERIKREAAGTGDDASWMDAWPPAAEIQALEGVLTELTEWQQQFGVKYIITQAPISDGDCTKPYKDTIAEQMRTGRVYGVRPLRWLLSI